MRFNSLIIAAGSIPALTSAVSHDALAYRHANHHSRNHARQVSSRQSSGSGAYVKAYSGVGTVADGWPSQDQWVASFDTLFEANADYMSTYCEGQGWGTNDSPTELADLKSAIASVGGSTGVDPRFILAIVMQESGGCVRAPTTNGGVVNPGLMQSHNGPGTCNSGAPISPCPSSIITQMITDGTAGTSDGDGLVQCLKETNATDVSMYYKAARLYNSGSIDNSGNLGKGIATHCYASDVANRLLGWTTGKTLCVQESIGDMNGSGASSGSSDSVESPSPNPTTMSILGGAFIATSVADSPTASPSPPSAPAVDLGNVREHAPAIDNSDTAQRYPYASSSCTAYSMVQAGDVCSTFAKRAGITFETLRSLNAQLDEVCSNLWLGYEYCVAA